MARNTNDKRQYYYSVGGRVKFGETLESAVLREVKEETGIDCVIDRLFCIHENYFRNDDGVPFHEISVFFIIAPNEQLLNISNGYLTDKEPASEYLEWIDLDNCEGITIYPDFYQTADFDNIKSIAHYLTDNM